MGAIGTGVEQSAAGDVFSDHEVLVVDLSSQMKLKPSWASRGEVRGRFYSSWQTVTLNRTRVWDVQDVIIQRSYLESIALS
jgi:hypothetical protein